MGNSESHVTRSCGVEVQPPSEGNSGIRRHADYPDKLIDIPFEDKPHLNTPWRVLEDVFKTKGSRDALGRRPKTADGEFGPYEWETYEQLSKKVEKVATALNNLGLKQEDPVGIFSINRPEWTTCLFAIWRQGYAVSALYDTLGAESSTYIVNDCNLSIVFVSKENAKKVTEFAANCDCLKHVVQFDDEVDEEVKSKLEEAGKSFQTLAEFMNVDEIVDPNPTEPDSLAYLMYTSGTTGNPKGVELTNRNLLASCSGVITLGVDINETDVYLSYLPLAHSFETLLQIGVLGLGGAVGFYQGNPRKIVDDVQALRPTIFAGVPRVYSRIYDKIQQTVASSGWLKKSMFETAFKNQLENVRNGTRNAFWDSLVFNKLKARLGGRVRLMATGAAPMPPHLMDFLRVAFGCELFQGYGMTENAAAAMVTPPGYIRSGTVGSPIPCCEIKLVDVPELNYLTTDKPYPRGEVCIRGHNVFRGYRNLPDKTKETLEEDGWLHTGDIGQWLEDGAMQIIDRKKNIFKLAHGEYVAAEELENLYGKSQWIAQIWIYGNSEKSVLVTVVTPDVETLIPWCKENGVSTNLEEAVKDQKVKDLILSDIKSIAKAEGVAGFKVPKAIHIEGELDDQNYGFNVTNNCMTPTFKLKRPQLKERYLADIERMYEALGE